MRMSACFLMIFVLLPSVALGCTLPGAGAYQLSPNGVIRLSDNALIPPDPGNMDWACYEQWRTAGNAALAAAVPTLQAAIGAKLGAGVAVISTGTPALNGTYAIDPATQSQVQAVSLYIQVNNKFPAAQTTLSWPDISGGRHIFPTTAAFQAFASVLADYVTALNLGQTPTTPLTMP